MSGDRQDAITAAVVARVRALRHQRGWSARRLADALTEVGAPMERSTLASLESGRRSFLTVAELCAFAQVFGISPSRLLGDRDAETARLVREIAHRFGIEADA